MPVVQDKYTIDVTNRFGISEDVVEDSGDEIENVDPFALINEMEAKAEEAKKQPKKKVTKIRRYFILGWYFGEVSPQITLIFWKKAFIQTSKIINF